MKRSAEQIAEQVINENNVINNQADYLYNQCENDTNELLKYLNDDEFFIIKHTSQQDTVCMIKTQVYEMFYNWFKN